MSELKTDHEALEQRVRAELIARLRTSPHLADTLAGIANWFASAGELAPERLEHLLRELVREGFLTSHALPDGRLLYGGRAGLTGAEGGVSSGSECHVPGDIRDE